MTIKTFSPNHTPTKHELYVQSRGNHAGRPLRSSIPNCFVMICSSEQEKDEYFNLVQALYASGAFKMYLIGSVIPLIRIKDVKHVIQSGLIVRKKNPSEFDKIHNAVCVIDKALETYHNQIETLSQLKTAYLHQLINKG